MGVRMRLSCNHLVLRSSLREEGGSGSRLLVDAVDAIELCHDGDYESLPEWQVAQAFQRESRSPAHEVTTFASPSALVGLNRGRLDGGDRAARP